jgi:predicted Zn-dependent peptidase
MAKNIDRVAYTEFPKLSLLNLFLGGFFGSRLMQELREERGLTYGIGSSISLSTLGHIWMIKGEMNSQNANLTQDCIRDILNKLSTQPPVGEELEKAKRYFGGQLRGSLDGPFSEPSRIQFLMKTEYPQQYYEEAMQTIWSTNTNTIAEMAYNYLNPDSFTIALAGEM